MNNRKRGFTPLFSVFQTEHAVLLTVTAILTIILVAMFPALLLPLLAAIVIVIVIVGIIGLVGLFAGLVDMNRESLQYRDAEQVEMMPDRPTHNEE